MTSYPLYRPFTVRCPLYAVNCLAAASAAVIIVVVAAAAATATVAGVVVVSEYGDKDDQDEDPAAAVVTEIKTTHNVGLLINSMLKPYAPLRSFPFHSTYYAGIKNR